MTFYINNVQEEFLMYTKCNNKGDEEPEDKKSLNDAVARTKLAKISVLREKLKQKLADKTAVASNINTAMDNYTKKLDGDLSQFEAEYVNNCLDLIVCSMVLNNVFVL